MEVRTLGRGDFCPVNISAAASALNRDGAALLGVHQVCQALILFDFPLLLSFLHVVSV